MKKRILLAHLSKLQLLLLSSPVDGARQRVSIRRCCCYFHAGSFVVGGNVGRITKGPSVGRALEKHFFFILNRLVSKLDCHWLNNSVERLNFV